MQKIKLLYIRPAINDSTPSHIRDYSYYQRENIFRNQFEFILIEDISIDYNEILKKYTPDIVCVYFTPMFQKNVTIQNIDYTSKIPKIAWLPCDGFSTERHNVITFHETVFKPHAYFSTETTYGGIDFKYLGDKMFYFPWNIDKDVFKNYHLEKKYPITLLGNYGLTYAWRTDIFPIIEQEFEYYRLQYPKDGKGIYGADFSKIINQSTFAPTCGGYTDALVKKHFEIPASYCCLITEKTEASLQAGFVDMQNCVFVDKDNFREKMSFLLKNPEKVKEITQNSYDFVHQNHADEHRTQLLDWYYLFKQKKENEHIIQPSLFGKLELSSDTEKHYHQKENRFTKLADEANALFWQGNIQDFREKYLWAYNHYLYYSPDILVPLALADICLGKYDEAMQWLKSTLEFEIQHNFPPNAIEYSLALLSLYFKKNTSFPKDDSLILTEKIGECIFVDLVILLCTTKIKNENIIKKCLFHLKNPYLHFHNTHTFFDVSLDKNLFIFEKFFRIKGNFNEFENLKNLIENYKPQPQDKSITFDNSNISYGDIIYKIYFFANQKPLLQRVLNKGIRILKNIVKKIIGRK